MKDDLQTLPTGPGLDGEQNLQDLVRGLNGILTRYYTQPAGTPVIRHQSRSTLYGDFHEPAPPETGLGMTAVLNDFEARLLPQSIQNWHPLSLNQMSAGAPPAAVVADCLTAMMNPTLATWEAAPAATVIERNVTEWLAGLLGLPAGSSGIFVPGGSMANLLALAIARDRVLSRAAAQTGLAGTTPGAILCSQSTHYSVVNAARLLGIGSEGVILVATGPRLEMLPGAFDEALAECSRRGRTPFALVLTAGSPLTGGVDPLAELAPRGHRHGLHVHVDAAFGGTLSLTHRRSLLAGIEQADSITWDAHKWLHMPLPCSALLVPDPLVLREVFENPAGYLFHDGDESGHQVDDLGRYTPLCAKRFDALKLWLVWRAWGTAEFRRLAESRLELTAWFHTVLTAAPDFDSAYEPVTPLVCFRHRPELDPERRDGMHRWIREQLRQRGHAFINIARLADAEQFRVILINPLTTRNDLLGLMTEIRELGRDFLASTP